MQLKRKLLNSIFIIFFTFFSVGTLYAKKLDLLCGVFNLSAEKDGIEGNAAGLGAYRISYFHNLKIDIELGVGYSVIMSDIVGGDLEYGLDLLVNYFPLTPALNKVFKGLHNSVLVQDLWRPYVGVGFYQREVQSVKVSYVGFGVRCGSEYRLDKNMYLKGEFSFITLAGEGGGVATEIGLYGGITLLMW